MVPMSAEDFQIHLNVPRETMDKFIIFSELLKKWQKSINLVSNNTLSDMWRRHFFDSAQLINFIPERENTVILDLGSGAGFPGLVLSILGVSRVHLVEAVGKKCYFMNHVIRDTGINAIVHNERIEKMTPFPVDTITSRACADIGTLLQLTASFRGEKTECLFLKGERWQEEIQTAQKKYSFNVKKQASKSEESGMVLSLSNIKGWGPG